MRRDPSLDVVASGMASGIHRLRISSGVSVLLLFMFSGAGASHAADSKNLAFDQTFAYCRDIDGYLVTPPEWKQTQAPQEISASNSFSPLPAALLRRLKVKGNVITPETAEKMALTASVQKPPSRGAFLQDELRAHQAARGPTVGESHTTPEPGPGRLLASPCDR